MTFRARQQECTFLVIYTCLQEAFVTFPRAAYASIGIGRNSSWAESTKGIEVESLTGKGPRLSWVENSKAKCGKKKFSEWAKLGERRPCPFGELQVLAVTVWSDPTLELFHAKLSWTSFWVCPICPSLRKLLPFHHLLLTCSLLDNKRIGQWKCKGGRILSFPSICAGNFLDPEVPRDPPWRLLLAETIGKNLQASEWRSLRV